ncbi:presequence protease, mitochondrial-like [Uloborus diversus]|uniref:presequence protease, mitochondrial-like n=1 Tax=Uloborus diversus TaxID=327109 RepID=UPI0024090104|nr:presequence protease, mitochondrial-like [Uloborus diversus]
MSFTRIVVNKLHCVKNSWKLNRRYAYCSQSLFSQDVKYSPGSTILGYSVQKVESIPELCLTATLLEHKATGVSHLHLGCDDTNNLFGVSLKTIPRDSTGVPHILEHLALCGSQKFPCRDPFFNMLNRSLATFMNAFTGSDSTMYVFSTQNAKDFQNLLSVYLDAVFYPSLHEKDFRQEGWRLEHKDVHDKNSPIIFKGVVFNEMKGVFSDPNQFYIRHLLNALFPSNTYSYESGGDPLVIPSLKWEDLKKFHADHYHPSNSRFLTYGNMPLHVHLEQIESNVLQNFSKLKVDTEVPDEILWSSPRELHIHNRFDPMAAVPEKQTIISNSYLLNSITDTYENFTLSILGNLLTDGPNSPFYQQLLESGIGPDYSPCTGFDGSIKQSFFSVGVREIAEKDINMVKEVIDSTFDNVVKTGFPEERIKGVLHNVEIATKHRTSNFGLNCAMGLNALWNHNGHPISGFKVNDHVKWFMKQLSDNPHYLQDKVAQYFKSNNHKLTLIMTPKDNFEIEIQKQEKDLLEQKLATLSDAEKEQIYKNGLELEEHQKISDASCLPTLHINDVKRTSEKTPLQFIKMKDISVQTCEQPTNEVVYFNAFVDAPVSNDDIMLLPLFSSIITQMGAGKRNYKELDQEITLKTGSFGVSVHISEDPEDSFQFDKGLMFSSYCLERNVTDMFSLWEDIFTQLHLEDHDRLSQLIRLSATDLAQSIAHRGHMYAMRKASSIISLPAAIREKTSGLTQISYMKKLAEMEDHGEIMNKLRNLSKVLLQKQSLKCSINSTSNGMSKALKGLESFLDTLPKSVIPSGTEEVAFQACDSPKCHFVLPLSVNYIGQSVSTIPYNSTEYANLKVAAKMVSAKFLHREIREKGGAYGGGASLTKGGQFNFYSYRDPNVSKTLNSFAAGVEWLQHGHFSDQDFNEAKLGVFSEIDAPVPPGSKGQLFFREKISYEMKQQLRENIFDCTKEDIITTCKNYLKQDKTFGTAVIGPENEETKSSSDGWSFITE